MLHNLQSVNSLLICMCIIISRNQLVNSRFVSPFSSNQKGLCRFGNSIGCCYGWKRNQAFQCEPVCKEPCEYGSCTGPDKCTCDPGYMGKTCSDDYNECRDNVCQHRCMNTKGSYRCYCRHGYVLSEDGRTCYRKYCGNIRAGLTS
ncbi:epidermal growth factor-like protein 6 [Glandiceps talaboti]